MRQDSKELTQASPPLLPLFGLPASCAHMCMCLQEDASEYLEEAKLKDLVAKYSEFINFPIYLYSSKQVGHPPHRIKKPEHSACLAFKREALPPRVECL